MLGTRPNLIHKEEHCTGYWSIDYEAETVRCEVCDATLDLTENFEIAAWRDRIIGNVAQLLVAEGRRFIK